MAQVEPLATDEQHRRYAAFAAEVYKGNPCWRPEDPEHLVLSISNRTPFASHSIAQPLWAKRGERVVATVTALVDERFNNHWKQPAGHLVLFEALPEAEEEARDLLEAACEWLRNAGCASPVGFSMAGRSVQRSAYDVPPTTFHLTIRLIITGSQNAGFTTSVVWWVPGEFTPRRGIRKWRRFQRELRCINKSQIETDTQTLWALQGATRTTGVLLNSPDEFYGLTAQGPYEQFVWIAECDGAAGCVLASDLNQLPDVRRSVVASV
jgi:hypothetical protein